MRNVQLAVVAAGGGDGGDNTDDIDSSDTKDNAPFYSLTELDEPDVVVATPPSVVGAPIVAQPDANIDNNNNNNTDNDDDDDDEEDLPVISFYEANSATAQSVDNKPAAQTTRQSVVAERESQQMPETYSLNELQSELAALDDAQQSALLEASLAGRVLFSLLFLHKFVFV
jgi:hypothetical protein